MQEARRASYPRQEIGKDQGQQVASLQDSKTGRTVMLVAWEHRTPTGQLRLDPHVSDRAPMAVPTPVIPDHPPQWPPTHQFLPQLPPWLLHRPLASVSPCQAEEPYAQLVAQD